MMTKIRMKGSSDTSMLSPPNGEAAWANAGEMSMKSPLVAAAVPAAPAAPAAPEMCAEYNRRRPNCNAAACGQRA